ncbi:MAG: nitrite reductase, partial [Bacteroidota bacterium]
LKYLIEPRKGIGVERFLELVREEWKALPLKKFQISITKMEFPSNDEQGGSSNSLENNSSFEQWKLTNVFEQKQQGFYGVKVRVPLGNISSGIAHRLAGIAEKYASEDIRITINQGLLFRHVKASALKPIYDELGLLDLNLPGFDSLADITSCPGTDTCNLGVTNSTKLAGELEHVVRDEYPHLISESSIKIKISGCMNSCGQHMIANIGFHGSSIKVGDKVVPAMQVVIGGGVNVEGTGFIAEKVIKVPTKRAPQVLRSLLDDFEENQSEGEYFNDYYQRNGKRYFYNLLKPLVEKVFIQEDYIDWGKESAFLPDIGVGECAGVMVDLVGTILDDAEENLTKSRRAIIDEAWAHAIFYAYNTFIIGAKAILLEHDVQCNAHKKIIDDFEALLLPNGINSSFSELVLKINIEEPTRHFASAYVGEAMGFLNKIKEYRSSKQESSEKSVIVSHYKA